MLARDLPRDLHPGAWWAWALGLAAAASRTTNPWLLTLVVLVACLMVQARRTEAPWALAFRLYLWLGLVIVVVRVLFRVLLGGNTGGTVLVDLPTIPLPSWAAGVTLLGPVTSESVLAGLYDGMRLAAIVICVGAANALANPKRLMASLPPALYEVGTAVVVALAVFPQLAESVQRVHRARRLRGDPPGAVAGLRRVVVPVLEDALERSIALAASMDVRGYGRSGGQTPAERRWTGLLLVGGLLGLCVSSYALLDDTVPRVLGTPVLLAGLALVVLGFVTAGRRVRRTRYRPDPWRVPETVTALSGLAALVLMQVAAARSPLVVVPDLASAPPLSVLALLAAVVGLLPLVATPVPPGHPAAAVPRRPAAAGRVGRGAA
jgi:energy-coupling factor transport system permease protein